MKKIIVHISWAVLLLSVTGVRAGEFIEGGYLGGKLGVNVSSATGAKSAPSISTIAYGLQGGYLQGGYIFDAKTLVLGVGAYFDWNPSEKHIVGSHLNEVTYGSRAFGLDAKVGLPLGSWMPYAKLGYGYSTGTKDLYSVAAKSLNATLGMEYKLAPQWSALGEFKTDSFADKISGTGIKNKTIAFGINYYFNVPEVVVVIPVEEVEVEVAPAPVVAPVPVTDAPPI